MAAQIHFHGRRKPPQPVGALAFLHLVDHDRALEAGELVAITTRHRALTNRISLVRLLDRVPARLEREFVAFITKALARNARG